MRLAVLSDIHGNLPALDAVLDDIKRFSPDVIVNLGDALSSPLLPAQTADRIMEAIPISIRGNHDRQILNPNMDEMSEVDRFTSDRLTDEIRTWLRSLPPTRRLDGDILLCHGTPFSDLEYLMEDVLEDVFAPSGREVVKERLGKCEASVVLCGHSHLPRIMELDENRLVINPGSVGLQAYDDDHPFYHVVSTGSPQARYALVSKSNGKWRGELKAVDYDWEAAARISESNGRDDWARRLRYGRL